ncbi:cation transporter [uncultured Thiocystis sp.]|jgi:predicted Co/Zn/Cd cation transporter (cation efflux family)|uniref:cation diffusion facilitator family transporter n=1 Tax=uncultured Thiocystis sp. TaxID=1202134 RepID=UPI0025D2EF21|nr:cation transporter [uncultured Thiocystis sp.]
MRIESVMQLRSELEARLLRLSVVATLVIAGLGVLAGLWARSPAVLFDGFFALIDAAITLLTLKVARLVAIRGDDRRFQFGFWHLEPLVIALKASMLIVLVAYAFLSAVNGLLKGGYQPQFGVALGYAVLVTLISFGTWWWMRRQADRLDSGLVRLDVKAWLLSALMTSALLIAFAAALMLRGTAAEDWIRLIDPAALALIALVLLPLPLREARESFGEILMISPPDDDARVRAAMSDFIRRHGFLDYRSYLSKTGRACFIEISVLVPPDLCLPVTGIDAMRTEIGAALGDAGPDRWLTIVFTADPTQL